MSKVGFNLDTEKTFATLVEAAWMTGGAIAGAKWIDRNTLFASNIAADPNFVNGFMFQHWGGIVAVGAAFGSTMISNDYAKLALIGLTIWGLLEEARNDFGGVPPNQNWNIMGPAEAELDKKLRAAAMGNLPIAELPMAGAIPMNYQAGVGFGVPGAYGAGVGFAM